MYDVLVVGAGFAGAVLAERFASQQSARVLVIDKRPHIGGNAFDEYDSHGVRVHRYGPHLFHTNDARVFTYLSRFTDWRPYRHKVRALVQGRLVPMPVNRDTLNMLFDAGLRSEDEARAFLEAEKVRIPALMNSEDVVLSKAGPRLFALLYRGYTRKHWGVEASALAPTVCGRLPVRFDCNEYYFDDRYQAIPLEGYSALFRRMLEHRGIEVRTGVSFQELRTLRWKHLIYTGPIDEYFGYCHGPLPYRSLSFRYETHRSAAVQEVAQINYPNDFAYTRSIEYKHITGQQSAFSTIAYEYPEEEGEPFYPVPNPENRGRYNLYRRMAEALDDVTFVGRLASYQYLNMDQVVAQALVTYRKLTGGGG